MWVNETCEEIRWIRGSPRPCERVVTQNRKEGGRKGGGKGRKVGEDDGQSGGMISPESHKAWRYEVKNCLLQLW